ncbi:MAG TPA: amidohydrolase family protein [Thermoanaerobaculia bacterium]|nr:amidohydrolase family protein [Thermoanaerobaculia bacterium]
MLRSVTVLVLFAFSAAADDAADLRAARAVFEENIEAIHQRDRAKYLSLYLHSESLVRTGPAGFATGYEDFAKGAGAEWPDTLEVTDMRLTPIRPGIVYGSYRYRVRYGANETSGISERLFVETPEGWRIALTGAVGTVGVPPSPRAIRGATLIDGRGGAPVANANIVVRDGKIDCAGTDCAIPAGIDVVDARGMFVTPGLVDAHVHFSQTGWADGRPDALDVRAAHPYAETVARLKKEPERFARAWLCSGITSVFDVGGYPWTLALHERADTSWPHVTAAGPLLSTLDHWVNVPAERQFIHLKSEESGREGVRYLAAHGAKAIKVWYVEENAAALAAAGDEAAKAKVPLIVHATELAGAKAAVRAGAKLLVHSVWDGVVDDELIALMKEQGTILSPTLTVMGGYLRMFESVASRTAPAIDDPNKCVDPKTAAKIASTAALDKSLVNAETLSRRAARTAERERMGAANLKRLADAGIPIATGTDAGNPLTLHGPSIYAEMEAMQKAGMTPMQVIVASTSVAARAARLDDVTGTIEKGRDADLLILAADPTKDVANFRRIRSVMRGGVLRGIEELSAMARASSPP